MGKKGSSEKKGVKSKSKGKPSPSSLGRIPAISSACFPSKLLQEEATKTNPQRRHKPKLETLLPGYIWVIHDFFSAKECDMWVNFMDREVSMELVKHKATRYIANRECYRYQKNDCAMAHRIFERLFAPGSNSSSSGEEQASMMILSSVLPEFGNGEKPVTCNPNLRLYKYEKGMSFGRHFDDSCTVAGVGETRLTMLVYLTTCQGGATSFEHNSNVSFTPRAGSLLLHVHGEDCLLHAGEPVESGVKYILRTDLVYSKQTKK